MNEFEILLARIKVLEARVEKLKEALLPFVVQLATGADCVCVYMPRVQAEQIRLVYEADQ